ncbi:MAG: PAS domain S-box protein, partial [Pseudomonadota bacterium]|nr:PAS domain S-box protein [Pseudomonadota bacterium]
MRSFSRNSLQYLAAAKTFSSVLIAGLVALIVSAYLFHTNALPDHSDLISAILYYVMAALVLIVLAALLAARHYQTLSRPLENLDQITQALPLLSSKKYDDARLIFESTSDHTRLREISDLLAASRQLSTVLEQLDQNVSQRSKMLHAANEELRGERDFVKNLLDTAQLIIITVDADFKLTMFNDYGEKITGFSEAEVLGSDVARFFPAGNWTEAQTLFKELSAGNLQIAQQESE